MVFQKRRQTIKRSPRPLLLIDFLQPPIDPLDIAINERGNRLASLNRALVLGPHRPTTRIARSALEKRLPLSHQAPPSSKPEPAASPCPWGSCSIEHRQDQAPGAVEPDSSIPQHEPRERKPSQAHEAQPPSQPSEPSSPPIPIKPSGFSGTIGKKSTDQALNPVLGNPRILGQVKASFEGSIWMGGLCSYHPPPTGIDAGPPSTLLGSWLVTSPWLAPCRA